MMVVVLAHTPNPTAIDTVEALCDAIIREDVKTQRSLMALDSTPLPIVKALNLIRNQHREIARDYDAKAIKEWDDNAASYVLVSVPLLKPDESLLFKCKKSVNQWSIVAMSIDSPHKNTD